MSEFTVFIDESGEAGIAKVRTKNSGGASPYMTLGAAIVRTSELDQVRMRLEEILKLIGKKRLHCRELSHIQRVKFAQMVSDLPIVLIGCISKKSTLGWYADRIEKDPSYYYNKCAHLLLECVGHFIETSGYFSHQVDTVFEKANFDYRQLSRYIGKIQDNPMGSNLQRERVRLLKFIDTKKITAKEKGEEPILALADLLAHSLYRCVDRSNGVLGITEPRYFSELLELFYSNQNGHILGFGVKAIHKVQDIQVEPHIASLFQSTNQKRWTMMVRP